MVVWDHPASYLKQMPVHENISTTAQRKRRLDIGWSQSADLDFVGVCLCMRFFNLSSFCLVRSWGFDWKHTAGLVRTWNFS
jgi:hypothetical protein